MGADLEKLIIHRNEILTKLITKIQSWDGEVDTGTKLIETNKIQFDQIIQITKALQKQQNSYVEDEKYYAIITTLATEQRKLMESLQKKKADLLGAMKQVKKGNNVVNSYISLNKKAIFIDKDI